MLGWAKSLVLYGLAAFAFVDFAAAYVHKGARTVSTSSNIDNRGNVYLIDPASDKADSSTSAYVVKRNAGSQTGSSGTMDCLNDTGSPTNVNEMVQVNQINILEAMACFQHKLNSLQRKVGLQDREIKKLNRALETQSRKLQGHTSIIAKQKQLITKLNIAQILRKANKPMNRFGNKADSGGQVEDSSNRKAQGVKTGISKTLKTHSNGIHLTRSKREALHAVRNAKWWDAYFSGSTLFREKMALNRAAPVFPLADAFSAYLDHDIDNPQTDTVIFNQVITNAGNDYNDHTGIFTCTVDGLYMFYFSVMQQNSRSGRHKFQANLVVNGQVKATGAGQLLGYADFRLSNMVLVQLTLGEKVYVQSLAAQHSTILGSPTIRSTSFSGVLLYV